MYANSVLYALFAIWMTFSPEKTAAAIGYEQLSASGRSEFLVVYGGLQAGLACFFAVLGANASLHKLGLVFALCLYVPIALYRLVTVGRFWPVQGTTLAIAALEILLLAIAVALLAADGAPPTAR